MFPLRYFICCFALKHYGMFVVLPDSFSVLLSLLTHSLTCAISMFYYAQALRHSTGNLDVLQITFQLLYHMVRKQHQAGGILFLIHEL
jgi:hypothetical protein